MATLVLFDVDGTLLEGSGTTHVRAFADALSARWGAEDPFEVLGESIHCAGVPVNGLVDAQVMALCLRSAGVGDADVAAELGGFRRAVVGAYRDRVAAGEPVGRVLPGVAGVLDDLAGAGVHTGLVTGNTEEICAAKMHHCGLEGRFDVGGFGGEVDDRALLFPVALEQARAQGWAVDAVCYVGDTPLDVRAARAAAVPLVAVCTGRYGAGELVGADAVLEGLWVDGAAEVLVDVARRWRRDGDAVRDWSARPGR